MTTLACRIRGGAGGRTAGAVIACVLLALAPLAASATGSTHTVRWNPSPSSDVAGYLLSIGEQSGVYAIELDLGTPAENGGVMRYDIPLERSVDQYLALRAYDRDGNLSDYSNEIVVERDGTLAIVGLIETGLGTIYGVGPDGTASLIANVPLGPPVDLRLQWCDLDRDGESDLLLGAGPGSGGEVRVLIMKGGVVAEEHRIDAGWEQLGRRHGYQTYGEANGETYPACGDIDGDGLDEVVVGLGAPTQHKLHIFDDIETGFEELYVTLTGLAGVRFAGTRDRSASAIPALGDVDGDGRDEIVIGGTSELEGALSIYDDAAAGFDPIRSALDIPYATGAVFVPLPLAVLDRGFDGFLYPAVGDLDGDGRSEIVVGLGEGGDGRLFFFDDAASDFELITGPEWDGESLIAGWDEYNAVNGSLVPSLADMDGDGRLEIGLGLGVGGEGSMQVLDDLPSGLGPYPGADSLDGVITSPSGAPIIPAMTP